MLKLAISPCPNDTFAFYALIKGKTSWREPLDVSFADIAELNTMCFNDEADFCKVSFHAYVLLRDRFQLLRSGSALGFGCGPLVVARYPMNPKNLAGGTIAVPGKHTTATLLLKLLLGKDLNLRVMRFDHIMPAVAAGEVDAGLIIHESRFTYHHHDLVSLMDLGDWWENESGHPIPLGGIVARKTLPEDVVEHFERALGESIDYAWENREEITGFMQTYAQEMDEGVMQAHVDLYVNGFTRDLGVEGRAAIEDLVKRSRLAGLCP